MKIRELQQHIDRVDVLPERDSGYVLKLVEEVGELAEAIRKGRGGQPSLEELKGSVAEELFDVLYYVLALANHHGVDMERTIELKETLNRQKYNR